MAEPELGGVLDDRGEMSGGSGLFKINALAMLITSGVLMSLMLPDSGRDGGLMFRPSGAFRFISPSGMRASSADPDDEAAAASSGSFPRNARDKAPTV